MLSPPHPLLFLLLSCKTLAFPPVGTTIADEGHLHSRESQEQACASADECGIRSFLQTNGTIGRVSVGVLPVILPVQDPISNDSTRRALPSDTDAAAKIISDGLPVGLNEHASAGGSIFDSLLEKLGIDGPIKELLGHMVGRREPQSPSSSGGNDGWVSFPPLLQPLASSFVDRRSKPATARDLFMLLSRRLEELN